MGSCFLRSLFRVSKSSGAISPRRTASRASAISAHILPTSGERVTWWKSSGVHTRTTRLLTLLLIPNIVFFFLGYKGTRGQGDEVLYTSSSTRHLVNWSPCQLVTSNIQMYH